MDSLNSPIMLKVYRYLDVQEIGVQGEIPEVGKYNIKR
jgi:hypothetical protein